MIAHYQEHLRDVPGIAFQRVEEGTLSSCNYMVVRVDADKARHSRDEIYEALHARDIHTKKYFYPPLHQHLAYKPWRARYEGTLPVAETLSQQGLALPLYGHIKREDCDVIIAAFRELMA